MPLTRSRPPETATSNHLKLHRPWRENATGGGSEVLFPAGSRPGGDGADVVVGFSLDIAYAGWWTAAHDHLTR
jgi:hypothetical protein